jgi:hypothetical protein
MGVFAGLCPRFKEHRVMKLMIKAHVRASCADHVERVREREEGEERKEHSVRSGGYGKKPREDEICRVSCQTQGQIRKSDCVQLLKSQVFI